jgi:hypothetical protein
MVATNKKLDKMKTPDFTTTILVDQTPKQVFNAINNVRGWWSEEIEGSTDRLNEVFSYRFRDIHACRIKLVEAEPEQKIIWLVLDNYFNFIKDQSEWKGTKIIFEISRQGSQTKLHFTHQGLIPAYECFDICKNAWTRYIEESLYNLITTGEGQPNNRETPRTEDEKKFAATGN